MQALTPAEPIADLDIQMSAIIANHADREGPLLPILHEVQESFGFVPEDAIPLIATALNLGRAEVHGVVSFYHDFRKAPAGRHILRLCRAEACQSVGAEALGDHVRHALGIDWHETTSDGALTLEPVFCLGLCACGPSAQIDGRLIARADEARIDGIIAEART